jgi:Autotransporter beta-domain
MRGSTGLHPVANHLALLTADDDQPASVETAELRPFLEANLRHTASNDRTIAFAVTEPTGVQSGGAAVKVGAGITAQINHPVSACASAGYTTSVDSTNRDDITGRLGLHASWRSRNALVGRPHCLRYVIAVHRRYNCTNEIKGSRWGPAVLGVALPHCSQDAIRDLLDARVPGVWAIA